MSNGINLKMPSSSTKGGKGNNGGGSGPPESFLSSLGSGDPSLAAHADQMWKMLDDLAEKDPAAYESFIKQTLSEAKAEKEKEKEKTNNNPETSSSSLSGTGEKDLFTPEPGFVVVSKCESSAFPSTSLFINHCSSSQVPTIQDSNGKPASSSTPISELRIPLSVGRLMNEIDEGIPCKCIDVVFHPTVIDRSLSDLQFQLYLIELSLQHIEEDHKVRINRGYKFVKEIKYKGRKPLVQRTEKGIDKINQSKAVNNASKNDDIKKRINEIMDTPSSNEIKLPSFHQSSTTNDEPTLDLKLSKNDQKKKPMIEELPSTNSTTASAPSLSKTENKAPLVSVSDDNKNKTNEGISSSAVSSNDKRIINELIGQPLLVKRREKALPSYSISTKDALLTIAVELPLENSAFDVNAELAPRSFTLSSPHYHMTIDPLPVIVDDTKSSAKFVKKTHTLKISAPIM